MQLESMVDLSIIIVSYNTKDILLECLESVYNNLPKNLAVEVFVVDNASSDGSVEMVKREFPKTIVIENKENFGFSKANNMCVEKAKGKYILFLNSDTKILQDVFTEMIIFMEKQKETGAATCRVELPSGDIDDASHRGFPTPWNAFCHFSGLSKIFPRSRIFSGYSFGWKDLSATHEIDACAGAFMIVRRVAGEQIGWWDEDFFWYGDDLDLCFRLKEKGWKIYYVPTVSILHYKGVSGGIKSHSQHLTTADEETKNLATKARFSAMKIFYRKHYLKKYPKFVMWLVMLGIEFKLRFAAAKF